MCVFPPESIKFSYEFCSSGSTEAMEMYGPELCYILDGFLGLYGLIITGMFIKEKVGSNGKLCCQGSGSYPLRRDPEKGRDLTKRPDGEYKELPVKRERQRKNEQVYQGLSSATRDTYDSLQMQPLR
uniref:T-cell surface glycoprotein CD3 zeta chain n=1 Tax=Stegastes partitus TaxID=144197 RepID=A0A3B5A1I6_9TELE